MNKHVEGWREAYPQLDVYDQVLQKAAPFPSLKANDYILALKARGVDDDVIRFVDEMRQELVWVYSNWTKCQRDSQLEKTFKVMMHENRDNPKVLRYLKDYARANNVVVNA